MLLYLTTYSFALWLGLYVWGRAPDDLRLRSAGLGLSGYALVVAALALAPVFSLAARLLPALLFVPAVFWFGAAVALLPDPSPLRAWLIPFVRYGLPWAAGGLFSLGLLAEGTAAYPLLAGLVVLLLLGSVAAAVLGLRRDPAGTPPRQLHLLTLVVTLFFALGGGLLLLPLELSWLPRSWLILAIGIDLAVLAFIILWLDAYEEGETLRPDAVRSLLAAGAAVLFLGGQIWLASRPLHVSPNLQLLLFSVGGTAVAAVVLARPLAGLLDRLAFSRPVRRARAELREAEAAVSRRDERFDLAALSPEEFARLTRRALSHLPDLPRLAASPLTALPQVAARLAAGGRPDDALGRANALRELLVEHIGRLKPEDGRDFAPTDDWRYYNALYFPYVAGLKPYSRRAWHDDLDPAAREALDWIRSQVPERTLYNWQNKGAELIAQDLRDGEL